MDEKKTEENEGGLSLTPTSLNCLPCRCRKNTCHKETTTTTTDKDTKTVSIIENRSSYKVGRGVTPSNDIFKPDQTGASVAICDTGWGNGRAPTPEECEQQIEKNANDIKDLKDRLEKIIYKTEEDIKEIKEDVKKLDLHIIKKSSLVTMD